MKDEIDLLNSLKQEIINEYPNFEDKSIIRNEHYTIKFGIVWVFIVESKIVIDYGGESYTNIKEFELLDPTSIDKVIEFVKLEIKRNGYE